MLSPFRIELHNITKSYQAGTKHQVVLQKLNWTVEPGQVVVLLGVSGSGKSTLLNLIAGLDAPDEGRIVFRHADQCMDWHQLADRPRTRFRLHHIGMIYQFFNLIPTLTLWENIVLPLDLAAAPPEREERARYLLREVGLESKAQSLPQATSGGEQQRAALVRALANEPSLILADEPTGNLDQANSQQVIDILIRLCTENGATLLMATHAQELASRADAIVHLANGTLNSRLPHAT